MSEIPNDELAARLVGRTIIAADPLAYPRTRRSPTGLLYGLNLTLNDGAVSLIGESVQSEGALSIYNGQADE